MAFMLAAGNSIVTAAWNPANLTPNRIRERHFRLHDETPISVEVSVMEPQPIRVRHDGILIIAGSDRLIASVEQRTKASLRRATEVLDAALMSLDQTPVSAAGINIRFTSLDIGELSASRRAGLDD